MERNTKVEEREGYLRALMENVSDVIAVLDADGRIRYVSPSIEHVLQYRDEELIGGGHYFERVHPDDRERVAAAFRRSIAAPSGPAFAETYRILRKDGVWRTLQSIGNNLLGHPQVRGVVLSSRDVTDRQRLEQELEQLNRLTSLGRLAAHVAHEFNNVLMCIQPVVEVIRQKSEDDPGLLRFAELAGASIGRGKRITTDILRYGRPAQPAMHPVRVEELIGQVADELRPVLPETIGIEVSKGRVPMYVNADRAQLSQVLINLALNASDAMAAHGGTLTVGARHGAQDHSFQQFIHLTVADNGEGIAADDLPYVFEPLFTTKRSGTGLGLSVVFQIVAAHGGHVSVESEPGKGSTFHVFIPAADGGSPVQEAADCERPTLSKLRVLIVEDDRLVARGLRWTLEGKGMEVQVVVTGTEVLPAIAAFHPDLLLLDLNLPDQDGRDVYARVAAQSPLPVIFSSGYALEHEIDALLDHPRTAFLMKPYSVQDLLQTIRDVVESKEACDERRRGSRH